MNFFKKRKDEREKMKDNLKMNPFTEKTYKV